jgi:hypothetical protein
MRCLAYVLGAVIITVLFFSIVIGTERADDACRDAGITGC